MHRNLAYLILVYYLFILVKIYKNNLKDFYYSINLIGILLVIQIIFGILTLVNGAQILLSSMHQISSIFLVSSAIYFLFLNNKIN